ncbi:cytosine deaminase protein-like protein [Saccharata proteae CBS 121410]|uniref:Cytosine deaminase protein-like protein n=1 Tax=Saccharata proteae CBS 121410 TaxID=1314787 RepID=A0A9P4I4I7_9PEZI|nr:cytosine deaminase protein-like protein [Saccharata proteae CBS 121410]
MASAYLASVGFDIDAELAKARTASSQPAEEDVKNEPVEPHYTNPFPPLSRILGVRLPNQPSDTLWDISIANGNIAAVSPHSTASLEAAQCQPGNLIASSRLLLPSLCHAHIHLDKCFLLSDPAFEDLEIHSGSFDEAMQLTTKAKARFDEANLLRRGRQLISESIAAGVTALRAFVEVDRTVGTKCLDAGLALKAEFAPRCHVQICAFAQLPAFSGPDGGEAVRQLMGKAASRAGVDVLGSTPYVEDDAAKSSMNVDWVSKLALEKKKLLDLHLDYHLDAEKQPFVWQALEILKENSWAASGGGPISLGHCTRLTRFDKSEWEKLKKTVEQSRLEVGFVGLPTSDLFMMRTADGRRGTLDVPSLIEEHGFNAAVAVNNVGNAFTPQGSCDPLAVASLGVGVYGAGRKKDASVLFECVSQRAKALIGVPVTTLDLKVGEPADFVLFEGASAGWRSRKSVSEVVYDPGFGGRTTVKDGRIITF